MGNVRVLALHVEAADVRHRPTLKSCADLGRPQARRRAGGGRKRAANTEAIGRGCEVLGQQGAIWRNTLRPASCPPPRIYQIAKMPQMMMANVSGSGTGSSCE